MAGPIRISILANASQAKRELDSVADKTNSLGSKFKSFAKGAAVAGLAVAGAAAVKFGADAVKAASDAQQSLGATETVFGKVADKIVKFSEGAADKYGLSANQYRENANLIGSLFKNQGVAVDKLAGKTDQMIGLGSDLAATFGGETSDAVAALGSAFKGEFDPLEKYGISLKQSDVNARLAAKGQDSLTGKAKELAEQTAITDLIMKQGKDSLGAFARESDTLANKQQRLGAKFEDIKAKVGEKLLPILSNLADWVLEKGLPALEDLGGKIEDFKAKIDPIVQRIKDFWAAFKGDGSETSGLSRLRDTFSRVWESITGIFESAKSIVTSLWQTFGGDLTRYAREAFRNVQQIIRGAFKVIEGIFETVAAVLRGDWKGAWDGIKKIASGAKDVIVGVVRQLWNAVKLVFSAGGKVLKAIFKAAWDGLKAAASAGWTAIKNGVSGAWNSVKSLTSRAWNAIVTALTSAWTRAKTAVSNGISGAVSLVRSLPGKILNAIGNLGSLLYNAGKDIIQGLINGVESMIGSLKDKLGSVTKLIPDIKGPPKKDARLLTPAGQLIMQGLIDGIDRQMPKVRKVLTAVTREIAGFDASMGGTLTLDARGAYDSTLAARSGNRGGNTYQITVEVPVGASSVEIGRELTKHISRYEQAKGRARR